MVKTRANVYIWRVLFIVDENKNESNAVLLRF